MKTWKRQLARLSLVLAIPLILGCKDPVSPELKVPEPPPPVQITEEEDDENRKKGKKGGRKDICPEIVGTKEQHCQ